MCRFTRKVNSDFFSLIQNTIPDFLLFLIIVYLIF